MVGNEDTIRQLEVSLIVLAPVISQGLSFLPEQCKPYVACNTQPYVCYNTLAKEIEIYEQQQDIMASTTPFTHVLNMVVIIICCARVYCFNFGYDVLWQGMREWALRALCLPSIELYLTVMIEHS